MHYHAVGADTGVAAVVYFGGRVARLAGAVAVLHLIERVVVVLVGVPAHEVVLVSIAIIINAVREFED